MRRRIFLLVLSVPAALSAGTEPVFLPSSSCAICHSRIPPPGDERAPSVAPAALWRGSMMAHASRDPFRIAKVREETALTPRAAAATEDKCLRCHAATQQYPLRGAGGMALRDLDPAGEGVTCTVCHQISRAKPGDAGGRRTTSVGRAASYLKDNRILPAGFDSRRDPRIAPVGTSDDAGFQPGSHRVVCEIALARGVSTGRVRVEALCQTADRPISRPPTRAPSVPQPSRL